MGSMPARTPKDTVCLPARLTSSRSRTNVPAGGTCIITDVSGLSWPPRMPAETPEHAGSDPDARLAAGRAIVASSPAQINPEVIPGETRHVADASVAQSGGHSGSRARGSRQRSGER